MKYKCLCLLLATGLLFTQCARRHKLVYNIPDIMPGAERKTLMATINKGKELFKDNCSECHGVFTKGKENTPDFTNTQITNYSGRFLRRDPKLHAAVLKMSPEQMNDVLTFLKYKRPQNQGKPTTAKKKK